MGRAIVRAAAESQDARVVAGVASASSAELGKDLGELAGTNATGVKVQSDLAAALAQCDVTIDFSNASTTAANIAACRKAGKPVVIGTTGFAEAAIRAIEEAAADIPVLVAPNTSLGVTLLIEIARAGRISLLHTIGQEARQEARHGVEQADEDHGGNDVEGDVERRRHLRKVGLPGVHMAGDHLQERQHQRDADDAIDQIADRQAIARRIVALGALEHRIDGAAEIGAQHERQRR